MGLRFLRGYRTAPAPGWGNRAARALRWHPARRFLSVSHTVCLPQLVFILYGWITRLALYSALLTALDNEDEQKPDVAQAITYWLEVLHPRAPLTSVSEGPFGDAGAGHGCAWLGCRRAG